MCSQPWAPVLTICTEWSLEKITFSYSKFHVHGIEYQSFQNISYFNQNFFICSVIQHSYSL